jgi:hypothetical protein
MLARVFLCVSVDVLARLNLCSKACPPVVLYSRGPSFEKYSFFFPDIGLRRSHCPLPAWQEGTRVALWSQQLCSPVSFS